MNPSPPPIVAAGAAIESASFRIIDAQAGNHDAYDSAQWNVVRRMIHTSGDFDFNGLTFFSPMAMASAQTALRQKPRLTVDVEMIRAGLATRRLDRLGVTVHQFNSDPQVIARAQANGVTRSCEAMREAWRLGLLDNGIVAIGNAPTALLEVIRLIREERVRPALVIGVPVGFIRAEESKEELMTLLDTPWIAIRGTKGGSTLAVAILHALMDLADSTTP
ncbi:MAG: precorrin-8X methylmutase [Magnetococcales bacterium]|nr:precorrin-8X methylmutase [Magnetococcales bacterium]